MHDSSTRLKLGKDLVEQIDRDGWASIPPMLASGLLDQVRDDDSIAAQRRAGVRNLLEFSPNVRALAALPQVRQAAELLLGEQCFVTKATFFDKTPEANWKVTWHQDLAIAVNRRLDLPGFGPWSVKAGITHVQPPIDVLESMLAVRVHLDDCHAENGPIRVLPGSHRHGRLTIDDMERWKQRVAAVECPVGRGGILAFRPLLLHASSPAKQPGHRRVIHFEFASADLPRGLDWHFRIGGPRRV